MSIHLSKVRLDYIEEQTRLFSRSIRGSQSRLYRSILDDIMADLQFENGRLVSSTRNYQLIAKLDKLYEEFIKGDGAKLMAKFVKQSDGLMTLNEKHFSPISNVNKATFDKAVGSTRDAVFSSLGVNTRTGEIAVNGTLGRIITDFAPVNAIKESLFRAVANNALRVEMRRDVQIITIGTKESTGSLQRHLNRTMDQPLEKVDRLTGQLLSEGLQLNFAQYQGGLVPLSREFCIVRNGLVFSREEIARFGTPQDEYEGYTNKSAGEFQGKPKAGYNPFFAQGGFRCLHVYSWISDELAYRLRPELKPPEPSGQ